MNNNKNIAKNINTKFVIYIVVAVVIAVFGWVWFIKGWTPLGLPAWVGLFVAVATTIVAGIRIFQLAEAEKHLTKSEEKSTSETSPKPEEKKPAESSEEKPTEPTEKKPDEKPNTIKGLKAAIEDAEQNLLDAFEQYDEADDELHEFEELLKKRQLKLEEAKAKRKQRP